MGCKPKVPKLFRSVKRLVNASNAILVFNGILILVLGIIIFLQFTQYDELITKKFIDIPKFMIATGVIMIMGSTLGLYAAFSKKFTFIAAFLMLLAIILVFEIYILITAKKITSNVGNTNQSAMFQSLNEYGIKTEVSELWNDLQMKFECCGVLNYNDYTLHPIPMSCCHIDTETNSPLECGVTNAYKDGCATVLGDRLAYFGTVINFIGMSVVFLQVEILAIVSYAAYRSKFVEEESKS